jgi:glycosyltransferase involved in cell wall biosynthesis
MKDNKVNMKIAIVSDAIYQFNKGGKEKRIYDITRRLAESGSDITVYCMKWWEGEKSIVKDNVKFYAISPYYPLYYMNKRSIKEGVFFALHCLKLVGRDFDIMEVDHIPHLVLFTAKIVSLLKRKPMVAVWHEVWGKEYWRQYLGKMGLIAYWIEKISVFLPDKIISVSEHTTRNLEKMLGRKQGITTIPNGLDFAGIKNVSPAEKRSDLIFVGRLLSHKNVDVLLRAVSIVEETRPHISLVVIGDGPEKINLIDLAKRLKIEHNVSFLGFLENHNEVLALMCASRVFVSPSVREGFGITAIEANACGLPVITINHENNAARDLIVNNESGLLIDLDARQLAGAIDNLLNFRKESQYYKGYAEKFDWNNVVFKIKEFYQL